MDKQGDFRLSEIPENSDEYYPLLSSEQVAQLSRLQKEQYERMSKFCSGVVYQLDDDDYDLLEVGHEYTDVVSDGSLDVEGGESPQAAFCVTSTFVTILDAFWRRLDTFSKAESKSRSSRRRGQHKKEQENVLEDLGEFLGPFIDRKLDERMESFANILFSQMRDLLVPLEHALGNAWLNIADFDLRLQKVEDDNGDLRGAVDELQGIVSKLKKNEGRVFRLESSILNILTMDHVNALRKAGFASMKLYDSLRWLFRWKKKAGVEDIELDSVVSSGVADVRSEVAETLDDNVTIPFPSYPSESSCVEVCSTDEPDKGFTDETICRAIQVGNFDVTSSLNTLTVDLAQRIAVAADSYGHMHDLYEEKCIDLTGLSYISSAVLKALFSGSYGVFWLGIQECSPDCARVIADSNRSVFLRGLKDLSEDVVNIFIDSRMPAYLFHPDFLGGTISNIRVCRNIREGNFEDVHKLTELTPDIAALLAKHDDRLTIYGLKELSVESARCLVGHQRRLYLDGFKELPVDVAEQLAQHGGSLSLTGLATLLPDAAEYLGTYRGRLFLSGLKDLPEDVARHLAQHKRSLHLNGLEELSLDAALGLSEHGGRLYLDGLKELSPDLAEQLSCYKGRSISLNGLTSLSEEAAKHLASYKGSLLLNSVETLSPIAVEVLSHHKGVLHLNGLIAMSYKAHKYLEDHRPPVSLPKGLKLLPEGVDYDALDFRKIDDICAQLRWRNFRAMGELTFLTLEDAHLISQADTSDFPNEVIDLSRVQYISEDIAVCLAQSPASLNLDGLTNISVGVARALSQGDFHDFYLSLNGLRELSPDVATELARNTRNLYLNGLVSLSDDSVQALVQGRTSSTYLNGFTFLSDDAARHLFQSGCGLSLNGLMSLPDDVIDCIPEGRASTLLLDGLTEISDKAAERFSGHYGDLSLLGLITISEKAAHSLARRDGLHVRGAVAERIAYYQTDSSWHTF